MQTARTSYEHNARALVTAIIDPNAIRTEYLYGNAGTGAGRRVGRILDVGGLASTESYEYDGFGYAAATVDANGGRVGRVFNALGQLEQVTLPAVGGQVVEHRMHFDNDRRLSAFERPRGAYDDGVLAGAAITDRFARDVLGNPLAIVLGANTADSRTVTSQFDYRGFPLCTINPDASRLDRLYDERGKLIQETLRGTDGTVELARSVFNRNGDFVRSVRAGGAITLYDYDGFARQRRVTLPNGTVVQRSFIEGDLLAAVEVHGQDDQGVVRLLSQTHHHYDERGRRIRETVRAFDDNPAAAIDLTAMVFHDPGGRVVRTLDHRGAETMYAYDGLGRIVRTVDPMGNEVRQEHDPVGNLLAVHRFDREPDGSVSMSTVRHEYDARNRRTATVMAGNSRHLFEYDDRDLVIAEIDPLGVRTQITYDAFGARVAEERDPGGLSIRHRWNLDAVGRITSYVDPIGEMSTYELDGLGRRSRVSLPNGQLSTRSYDAAGNVLHEQLSSGAQMDYQYDAANRLTRLHVAAVPAGTAPVPDQEFRYDGLDRVVSAHSGGDDITRRFDSRGRLRREQSAAALMACDYDDATGSATKTWPDGRAERISTDLVGRATTFDQVAAGALGGGNGLIASLGASGPDLLGSATLRGGLTLSARYDDRKRLVGLAAQSPAGLGEMHAYRYDTNDHRRIEVREGVAVDRRLFSYDAAGRLTASTAGFVLALDAATEQANQDASIAAAATAAAASPADGFEYDDADARVRTTRSGQPPVNYVNLAGHVPQSAGGENFAHGPDGVRNADGQFNYRHDALGRIVEVVLGAVTVCAIEYDALGRPSVLREGTDPPRTLTWFGAHVVQESDGPIVVRQHTRDAATGLVLAHHALGASYHPLFDGRANLVGLADESGNLIEAYRYTPFGVPTILDGSGMPIAKSAFGVAPVFGGQRYLASAGRYLSTRRLMDPRHGLFLSPDPLGYANSPSLYVYAAQDPVDLIDPEGEFAFLAILAVMAIGAVVAGGMNVARQHIQMAENPGRRALGFSWGEFFGSMGIGAIAAPVVVFAPEVAIPLAALGVAGGAREIANGNYWTGAFDIATSLAPFGSKRIRTSTFGAGTVPGRIGGLGPVTGATARMARFDAIASGLPSFRPSPFDGREIGIGIARPDGSRGGGHAGIFIEDAEGNLSLFHKNGQRVEGAPWDVEASWQRESPLPEAYDFGARRDGTPRPPGVWSYRPLRVPASIADRMNSYAIARQAGHEEFVFMRRSCGNFAADALAEGGFSGIDTNGNGASGLSQSWNAFAPAFTTARDMAWTAGFWSSARQTTPNRKCVPGG